MICNPAVERKNLAMKEMRKYDGARTLDKAAERQQGRDSQGLQRADLA